MTPATAPVTGHRPVSYRAGVATKRATPQRTVGIDEELWQAAQRIARQRREKVSDVLRRSLVDYVETYKHLDPGPSEED